MVSRYQWVYSVTGGYGERSYRRHGGGGWWAPSDWADTVTGSVDSCSARSMEQLHGYERGNRRTSVTDDRTRTDVIVDTPRRYYTSPSSPESTLFPSYRISCMKAGCARRAGRLTARREAKVKRHI